MFFLGIESSCDETAIAIIDDNKKIYANFLYSQIKEHSRFGGVVPEIASRKHIEKIDYIFNKVFSEVNISIYDIDAIAVTQGPGLVGSLLVGLNFSKAVAYYLKKPLYPVHHIEGHILSVLFENNVKFPFISLIASGGHTSLFLVEKPGKYKLLGKTLDDAAGEAFDKVAKMLNLGYPGGPIVEKMATQGEANIKFPKSFIEKENLNFSFSGIKTSVLQYIKKNKSFKIEDICASFQTSITETFIFKLNEAVKKYKVKNIAFGGGVACNSFIKNRITEFANENNLEIYTASPKLCSDNGAMIALAGYFKHITKQEKFPFNLSLNAEPRMKLC